jgi:hypothetical protein
MRGICDTCEQLCEVFLPAGRTHFSCSDCYVNVGTAVQLYRALCEVDNGSGEAFELEAQLKMALVKLFSRTPYSVESDEPSAGVLVSKAFVIN